MALFGKIMEPVGDAALLEEVCPWGKTLRVRSLASLPVCFLSFLGVDGNMISQLPVPVACCRAVSATMDCLSGTLGAIDHFFHKLLFWSWCFMTTTEK